MPEYFKFKVSFDILLERDDFPEWILPHLEDLLEYSEKVEDFKILKVQFLSSLFLWVFFGRDHAVVDR